MPREHDPAEEKCQVGGMKDQNNVQDVSQKTFQNNVIKDADGVTHVNLQMKNGFCTFLVSRQTFFCFDIHS